MNSRPLNAPAAKAGGRVLQLDILRGIAILLVLGRHFPLSPTEAGPLSPFFALWRRLGWTGVDLFFVLSGFLIGGLLFKEIRDRGSLDVKRFLIRRGFKIWPAYYAFLTYVVLYSVIDGASLVQAVSSIKWNLLHLQNYFTSPRAFTWSLAVEEHFYLALPMLLVFLLRKRMDAKQALAAIPWVTAGLIVICTLLRAGHAFIFDKGNENLILYTHLRIDGLAVGVCIAYIKYFQPERYAWLGKNRLGLWIAGLVLISPMVAIDMRSSLLIPTFGIALLYLAYGAMLIAVVQTPLTGFAGRIMQSPPSRLIAFIGFYSYSIYLWHIDTGSWLQHKLAQTAFSQSLPDPVNYLMLLGTTIAGSVIGGFIAATIIEKPALALRTKLFPAPIKSEEAAGNSAAIANEPILLPDAATPPLAVEKQ